MFNRGFIYILNVRDVLQVEKHLSREETLRRYFNESEIKVLKILIMPISHKELVNDVILEEFSRFYFFEKNLESLSKKIVRLLAFSNRCR